MPLPIPSKEPTAYETACKVLNPPRGPQGEERRAVRRHPFRFVQRIAAYDGQDRLDQLRFFPVECHDISRRGIAFLLPGRLDFSTLVVELGSEGERMYFEAEIVNFRRLPGSERHDNGKFMAPAPQQNGAASEAFLVGCRFKRKLDLLPA